MKHYHTHLIGLLLIVFAATLYFITLDDGLRPDELTGGDLITHQYAQVEARPSNAPGYPLYTMGGWLWFRGGTRLMGAWLNPTQILSLYSMMWGIASLMVLYAILLRICDRQWLIPALLTAYQAVTFFFWYYSVTTEQYSSAVFQTLLMVWLAFKWDDRPRHSLLLWMAFLSGTMLANMVTTLFIMPPLLWFIFFRADPTQSHYRPMLLSYLRQPLVIAQAIAVTALPLLSYSYIYLRGAQHPEWRGEGSWPTAWAWFVDFITIQQGQDEFGPGLQLSNIITAEFPSLMWHELTPLIFFGGLIGIAALSRRRAILLYATLTIYLIFCWGYRFGNWYQVIIPAYPLIIIGVAAGLWQVQQRPTLSSWRSVLIPGLLMLLLMVRLATNFAAANQHQQPEDTALEPAWAILADEPTTPAMIYLDSAEKVALQYLQTMGGQAQGLMIASSQTVQLGDTPTYFTRQALLANPALLELTTMFPHAIGPTLIAVTTEPLSTMPSTATPINQPFGQALRLVGWEQQQTAPWQLTLYWQSDHALTTDYTISVRPMRNEQPIEEGLMQDHQPVWGYYPTSQWQPHTLVRDVYALPMPEGTWPNKVQIVIYHPTAEGFENLDVQVIELY